MKSVHVVAFGLKGPITPSAAQITLDDGAGPRQADVLGVPIQWSLPINYGWHAVLTIQAQGYANFRQDIALAPDSNVQMLTAPKTSQLPSIVGDHFELNGNRWVWRMLDGFCDHALLFSGNVQQVRDTYKQAQDLDVRGKRVFGMMQNITHFDPRTYYPKF